MAGRCPIIGVSSEGCTGAVAPRCLSREDTTTSSEGARRSGARWCARTAADAAEDARAAECARREALTPIAEAMSAAFAALRAHYAREAEAARMARNAHPWMRVYGPRVLSHAAPDLRTPARAYGDTAVTLPCGPSRPVASWLREGQERGESIRALARPYGAVYTAALLAAGLRSSDRDHSSAYAPEDARWSSGASRTLRVRTPDGVRTTTVTTADVPTTAPVWRAPTHGRIAARRVAARHGARLARGVAAMVSDEAPIAAALSCDITALATGYARAVVAVRRAETGLSDLPCEACRAAARSRIIDALVVCQWGHDLGELDTDALAAERARLAELHAPDVARAERDALPSARACRAATERALLAWREACDRAAREDRPEPARPDVACVCSRGVTRTARKGRKGALSAPVAIVDRGIIAPRRG